MSANTMSANTISAEEMIEKLSCGEYDYVKNACWNNEENSNLLLSKDCPPQLLKMILEKGEDDWISWKAVRNPNCPPKEKIKWIKQVSLRSTCAPLIKNWTNN